MPAPRGGAEDAGETMFLPPAGDGAATLPFVRNPSAPEPPAPPVFEAPAVPVQVGSAPVGPLQVAQVQAVLMQVAPVEPLIALGRPVPGVVSPGRSSSVAEDAQQPPLMIATEGTPLPPPMLGPLARAEMTAPAEPTKAEEAKSPAVAPAAAPTTVPEAQAEAPKPKIEDYPIERCARIAARVDCAQDSERAAEVLRKEDLDAEGWKSVHEHWLSAIRARAERRDKALMSAYDRAYVSELEAQRGVIAPEDYARLAEAAERGAQADALSARGLPPGAWPSIHRVWIERMVKDIQLTRLVRTKIDALQAES